MRSIVGNEQMLSLAQIYAREHFATTATPTTDGGVNYTYFLGTPPRYVLKISRDSELLKREALALQFWKEQGIPVPDFTLDSSGKIFTGDALVLQYAHHQTQEPNPSLLGRLLSRVHALAPPREGMLQEGFGSWKEFLIRQADIESTSFSRRDDVRALINELDESNTQTLLHGDYCPGHILFDGDKLAAIIDPDPLIGDPLWDVAWYLIHNPTHRERFLYGYASEGLMSEELERLKTYECVACYRKMATIAKRMNEHKANREDTLLLEHKFSRYSKMLEELIS